MKTISIKDIEGIRIGNAQNFTGGTGCTVILSETGMCAGLDVRGGGPASRESELFPTQYRGGVQGIMFFLVRGALGIWSLVGVGAIMGDISANPAGFFPAAVIMCAVLLISLVVGVIWCPKTQGKTLDQITEERYGKLIK